ncbi:MAG: hypothetical protein WCI22_13165 [Actinomycetota bacterium]
MTLDEAPSDERTWWVRHEAQFFTLAVLVGILACLVGVIAAIHVYAPRAAIGPLSEWVPGTITALALAYTFAVQRRSEVRQQTLDQRQRDLDERQQDESLRKAEADHRALAEKVYVWSELQARTMGTYTCIIRWSNVSDAPAFLVTAMLHFNTGPTEDVPLGTIPPQQRLGELTTNYSIPQNGPPPAASRFVVGVGCRFKDANGVYWTRDPAGTLTEAV